jgi:hypothetical protein
MHVTQLLDLLLFGPHVEIEQFLIAAVNRCATQNQMKVEFFRKLSEPRCFHALALGQP